MNKDKLMNHGRKFKKIVNKIKKENSDYSSDVQEENFYIKNKKIIKALVLGVFISIVFGVYNSVSTANRIGFNDDFYNAGSIRGYESLNEIDWVDDRDLCQGKRRSDINPDIYYFKSKGNVVNLNLPILNGYRWAGTEEYKEMINKPNNSKVYTSECGYSGIPTDSKGNKQKNFYFYDSIKTGKSVNASSREGKIDFIKKSDLNSFAGYILIKN